MTVLFNTDKIDIECDVKNENDLVLAASLLLLTEESDMFNVALQLLLSKYGSDYANAVLQQYEELKSDNVLNDDEWLRPIIK